MKDLKEKNKILVIIVGVMSILLMIVVAVLVATLISFAKQQKEDAELADYTWGSTPITEEEEEEKEEEEEEEEKEEEEEEEEERNWEDWEEDWDDYEEEEEEEEEDSNATKNDPYGIYVTSEDYIKNAGGFAVERNNTLYGLTLMMPYRVISEYDSGYQFGTTSENVGVFLFAKDRQKISDVPTGAINAITLIGDFPTYHVEAGEELRVYDNEPIEEVKINRLDFYGYTIPAIETGIAYFPVQDHVMFNTNRDISNPAVLTATENPVEDVRKLEYGKEYIFEWYQGMEYHSEKHTANCRCYTIDNNSFTVPVKMTKNGYGVVDLTGLEAGSYMLANQFPIEYVE